MPSPHYISRDFPSLFSLILVLLAILSTVNSSDELLEARNKDPVICKSTELYYNDDNVFKLQNCTIVEGHVKIFLLNYGDKDFSFPNLREITDYLFIFRVSGLRSVGDLFPNLSVIRGNNLFQGFSFLIFENVLLENLGLSSLTKIIKGSVFIAKNPILCYINTIKWNIITSPETINYIANNRAVSECPSCSDECPAVDDRSVCWSHSKCQRLCPSDCSSCTSDGKQCCHSGCLGGCDILQTNQCDSCSRVLSGDKCESSCSAVNGVEFMNWRCIKKKDCYTKPGSLNRVPMKLYQSQCLTDCPVGFTEETVLVDGLSRLECKRCPGGKCRKVCEVFWTIKTVEDAQKLKGCVVIKGALVLQVSGNIKGELEDSLSSIEEITYYLKVTESFQLTSLNFLRNLKKIHGLKREQMHYSLVVMENKNLELLWDWDHRNSTLQINGSIFFHFNPKLCKDQIDRLIKETGVIDTGNSFVSSLTHGVKTVCNITELEIVDQIITPQSATIVWKQFEFHDLRKLLGYVIYYKEAQHRNVTIYDGRYVCGGGDWHRLDNISYTEQIVINPHLTRNLSGPAYKPVPSNHSISLMRLKPFTQYAYFVKTLTVRADREAQSAIHYFETLPDSPSKPQYLTAVSNSSSQIALSWKPPLHPNGLVTHYAVTVYILRDIEDTELDMCRDENKEKYNATYDVGSFQSKTAGESPETEFYYYMRDDGRPLTDEERNRARNMAIYFEDMLQNRIYIKRSNATASPRPRRSIFAELYKGKEEIGKYLVWGTSFLLSNLTHFTRYEVEVRACRAWQAGENQTSDRNCSIEWASAQVRTLPMEDADGLDGTYPTATVSNSTSGSVNVRWQEPTIPNGFIKYFVVEVKRLGPDATIPVCVSRKEYLSSGRSFTIRHLAPGNYSLRVWADSLHGLGSPSEIVTFVIPDENHLATYLLWIFGSVVSIAPFVIGVTVWLIHRADERRLTKMIISLNPEYEASQRPGYVQDDWEIPRANVELLEEIGQGSFGKVYEGTLVVGDSVMRCAIKTITEGASEREKAEFLNEASVMKAFTPYHVVRLLGVVSVGCPVFVVMELMTCGDLKSYLRSRRPDAADPTVRPPSLRRLLQMAAEIADGMAYLSSKKYVHRDLAARNCMVAEDLTVKIGDFGMARDIYEGDYYRKGTKGLMPVRWMAPESLRDGIFLTLSDVWSYGVVLYEMVTLAAQPYQGLTNDQVVRYILDGGTMERPENCPEKLHVLMRQCWRQNPCDRPTFLQLVTALHQDTSHSFRQVSFYDSEEGRQARTSEDASGTLEI